MTRQIVDLAGDNWRLGQAPTHAIPARAAWSELDGVEEWLPATVPGNVRADLIRAGHLPELSWGTQAAASLWVDDHCWWLARRFSLPHSPARRVHLVLRGVDYVSDLFLNGHHLGRHEGMFSPQVHDVTDLLEGENWLAVRVVGSRWLPQDRSSAWEKFLNHVEAKTGSLAGRFPHRRDTLKCQMGFGWDFAPPLRTMGIWDEVYAIASDEVFIRDLIVRQQGTGEGIVLAIQVEIDALQERSVQLRCTLTGETFQSDTLTAEPIVGLVSGGQHCTVELAVPEPRLWWPWDHGRANLYRLDVQVKAGDQILDAVSQTVGLRQVELEDWTLYVNGRRIYARGANWVPADILPGRVAERDYDALITLARQANMNMLRVWGGGLREKRAFYDLCDRSGILVWQEFPFACAFLTRYPRSPDYLHLVRAEAQAIVRDLRNHPSLVLWCGGNEFSPQRNAPLVESLQQVVAREDPTRPFLPASPGNGDSHNWQVWHEFQPPAAYREDNAGFASEFGLQAPPDVEALRRFIPPEDLWPPGPSWTFHGAGLEKLRRYGRPFLTGQDNTLEAFVQASQRAQVHGLQIAVEHYRRRKARGCGGVLIWQLNEPWPAVSWALLDFFRQPKPAYETVRRLLDPLLVSVDYAPKRLRGGDDLSADVWIVNDRSEALPGCRVEVVLWEAIGQPAVQFARTVDVVANSAGVVGHFCWRLPAGSSWRMTCRLSQGDRLLAGNEYDLGDHDEIQPTLRQRVWTWLSGLVTPA
jgi:beta-mannosidase